MSFAAPALEASGPQGRAIPYDLAPPVLALAMFALCAVSPAVFNDGDTFSHIATGSWMVAHHAIPHADPFTSSVPGKPWTAHEWLSELALWAAWRAAGLIGVALLTGAAAASAVYIVARSASRRLGGPALAAVGVLALMLIGPGLLARPHILALPLLALWADALTRAGDRAPPLWVAALMLPWANLHGGFAFGLALIAPFALESWLAAEQKLDCAKTWAIFTLASVAAALINPYGAEGLLFPVRLLGVQSLARVGEWAPESFAHLNALEIVILGLIGVAALRPFRLPPIRLLVLLGLLHMSLSHARHEMLLAVIGPMLLARPLAKAFATPAGEHRPRLAALLALGLALAVGRFALPAPKIPGLASTQAALAALPAQTKAQPGLNGYAFGGYLIFEGVKPYVDGRADMFGDAFLDDYARLARGEDLAPFLQDRRIAWTLFAPDQGAVAAMDAMPGWKRVYADARAVAHVRTAP
jgi:hypothetical protein